MKASGRMSWTSSRRCAPTSTWVQVSRAGSEMLPTSTGPSSLQLHTSWSWGSARSPGWEFWGAASGDGGFISLFDLREKLRATAPPSTSSKDPLGDGSSPSPKKKARRFTHTLPDLLELGLHEAGETVRTTRKSLGEVEATLTADGHLELEGTIYKSPSAATVAASGKQAEAGWEFWAVDRDGDKVTLYEVRLEAESPATDVETP
jgi:hypothetical protein